MCEAFRIATDFFLPPYELQYRVGALYILYALYETQPHKPKYKIRMCLDHWRSAKHLMETLKCQGHLDAVYIFNQLKMNKAFIFTAMPKKMIFHSSYMELKPEQNPTERWLDRHRHSLITESFDDTTLEVRFDTQKFRTTFLKGKSKHGCRKLFYFCSKGRESHLAANIL